MQLDEQNRLVMEMEASLESQARELDNRLTEQQQQYESEINSLLQKISEKENSDTKDTQQFIKWVIHHYHLYIDLKMLWQRSR